MNPGQYREASYLLTRYLSDSCGPPSRDRVSHNHLEYDPTWLHNACNLPKFRGEFPNVTMVDHARALGSYSSHEMIIELGSGMGTAGLAAAEALRRVQTVLSSASSTGGGVSKDPAATSGEHTRPTKMKADIVLTDLPEVCTLLRENVTMQLEDWKRAGLEGLEFVGEEKDQYGEGEHVALRIRELSWGNVEHVEHLSRDLRLHRASRKDQVINLTILCSDLVYFPHLLAPLLRTLIHLTSPSFVPNASAQSRVIMSYRLRSFVKETQFWRAFGAWFSFQPVLERRRDATTEECEWSRMGWDETALSFVFVAHRRPETLTWECPQGDDELLHGRGGDDTFEILLMMCNDAAQP